MNPCNLGDKHGQDRHSVDNNRARGHHRSLADHHQFGHDIRPGNVDNVESKLGEIRNFCIFCHRSVSTLYL